MTYYMILYLLLRYIAQNRIYLPYLCSGYHQLQPPAKNIDMPCVVKLKKQFHNILIVFIIKLIN